MSNFLDTKDKAFWRALLGVVSLGVSNLPGGPDRAPLSRDQESRVVSNWRCQVARRSGDVSPPSNQTPVRARDTAT